MPFLLTGLETCPEEIYSKNELHINGDIVFSILQYLWATGDATIITSQGFGELLLGVGDFWLSKVKFDDISKMYCICGKQSKHSCQPAS